MGITRHFLSYACAAAQSLHPDFITPAVTHLAEELVAACQNRSRHGGSVCFCAGTLLVSSVSCDNIIYESGTSEIVGVLFQGTTIICITNLMCLI